MTLQFICIKVLFNDTGEDNADAYIKRQMMGRKVVIAVTEGQLDLGPGSKSAMVNSISIFGRALLCMEIH